MAAAMKLRDFPSSYIMIGTKIATARKRKRGACMLEATVRLWCGSIREKLGHLTVSTIQRTADSQPDSSKPGCKVESDE
jgi:hypothetical protein